MWFGVQEFKICIFSFFSFCNVSKFLKCSRCSNVTTNTCYFFFLFLFYQIQRVGIQGLLLYFIDAYSNMYIYIPQATSNVARFCTAKTVRKDLIKCVNLLCSVLTKIFFFFGTSQFLVFQYLLESFIRQATDFKNDFTINLQELFFRLLINSSLTYQQLFKWLLTILNKNNRS